MQADNEPGCKMSAFFAGKYCFFQPFVLYFIADGNAALFSERNKTMNTRALHTAMIKITLFINHNAVFCIVLVLAAVTCFFIPPDAEYVGYFDFKTLACLFSTLAVVCALKNIKFFTILARGIVKTTGTLRTAVFALVFITFFGSMLIANDMALLTFLPLGYFVLSSTGQEKAMAYTFILQNIAANLGGMLTPFGNPQNLYLFSRFNIPTGEFMLIMLPPFLAATLIIVVCCLPVKNERISLTEDCEYRLQPKRTAFYLALFVLSIVMVFRIIPYWAGLSVIVVCLFLTDRKALLQVDYFLLGTFACMFVFAGNMARIDIIRDALSSLLSVNTLVFSAASCQIISNVPSAVLLSRFTDNYAQLLQGVNIGGTGTLIASLASLITFREYTAHKPGDAGSYVAKFTVLNLIFLIVLTVVCSFVSFV